MKTILVPTDFSPAANNAARYATQLGKFLKASITLFNAGGIPENKGMIAIHAWPAQDDQTVKRNADQEIRYSPHDCCTNRHDEKKSV